MAPQAGLAAEPQTITFYSWMGTDGTGRSLPSSQIIRIQGGEGKLATDGTRFRVPVLEARFHNGMCHTSDPIVIAELRRIAALSGSCISEDKEAFYAATMTAKELQRRTAAVSKETEQRLRASEEENNRLRALLEEKGKAGENPRPRPHA